jgi:iron complex transport system permease protein
MGSLNGLDWQEIYYLTCICSSLIFICLLMSKSLDALLLGEQYALSMGVAVPIVQKIILFITALLAGAITAFCGPIAFVGIAVPHIARMLFGTHRHVIVLSTSVLIGMITLLFCQFIAQLPGSESLLPINVVTSFLGAPMVIYIVLRRKVIRS